MKSMLVVPVLLAAAQATVCAAPTVLTDVAYGSAGGEKLLLDICIPEGPGPFPAAILVHGGGWTSGDKSGGPQKGYMAPLHEPLTHGGIAWFSINYRLAPRFPYPAPVEDIEVAIRWVKAHAAEYRVDANRLALSGESAGAHLAMMAAVRATPETRVAALVPIYGAFDLVSAPAQSRTLSGGPAALMGVTEFDEAVLPRLREASPYFHVQASLPPVLLVHGDADQRVAYEQSTRMLARLRELGVTSELITIKGGGHGMLPWDQFDPEFKGKIVAWLQRALAR